MDFSNDQIKEYKIEVFVPADARDAVIRAIRELKVGRVGLYYNCMSETEVYSSWAADDNASPFLGNAGECFEVREIKIETRCRKEELEAIVAAIKSAHPYESVCINVIPLISF